MPTTSLPRRNSPPPPPNSRGFFFFRKASGSQALPQLDVANLKPEAMRHVESEEGVQILHQKANLPSFFQVARLFCPSLNKSLSPPHPLDHQLRFAAGRLTSLPEDSTNQSDRPFGRPNRWPSLARIGFWIWNSRGLSDAPFRVRSSSLSWTRHQNLYRHPRRFVAFESFFVAKPSGSMSCVGCQGDTFNIKWLWLNTMVPKMAPWQIKRKTETAVTLPTA